MLLPFSLVMLITSQCMAWPSLFFYPDWTGAARSGGLCRHIYGVLEMEYNKELETITDVVDEEVLEQAECICCGLKEDCTPAYIVEVQESYSGNWVCGLCSESLKERLIRAPKMSIGEAVSSLTWSFSRNSTIRPGWTRTFHSHAC